MSRLLRTLACALALTATGALPVQAQTLGQVVSSVLTIDRDVLFTSTAFGQRVNAELEAESDALAEETREIEKALEAEERTLTAQRATLPADEFRALADAFDEKVVALRNDRDAAQNNFVQRYEEAQRGFYARIGPILGALMQERGALVILDKRSVLLSVNAIDITQDAVARIDAELGDGTDGTPEGAGDGASNGSGNGAENGGRDVPPAGDPDPVDGPGLDGDAGTE